MQGWANAESAVERLPLGEYREFRRWSGKPKHWGPPGSGWQAWFGGQVIDGLCDTLDRHLAGQLGQPRRDATPAAIGCVPWLTSDSVIDRLLKLSACCIVIDKGRRVAPKRLVMHDRPFPNVLPGLRDTAPSVDGSAPVIGPYSGMPEHELGPVRVVGWRQVGIDTSKPLLHAKMLVLGHLGIEKFGPDDSLYTEELVFTPSSVWWGSANWTRGAEFHIEFGCWSDDPDFTEHATEFVSDVVRFSEPIESTTVGPEPDLVTVVIDDEAMAEAAMEQADAPESEEWDRLIEGEDES